jgi:ABC-2 type transport system ATP-binding protein
MVQGDPGRPAAGDEPGVRDPRAGAGVRGTGPDTCTLSSGESIIRIDHVTKIFTEKKRSVVAVDDVSFAVKRGEIFGLLGPNGAGKSTLIRILTTLLSPTSGTACVDTFDIHKDPEKIRGIIGVCPQNSTLDVELTAYDNLAFYGRLVDVDENVLDARIRELLAMADLADRANMPAGTFSGGMRRKLEIVRAFIHHPLILFLDEPTIGLDPESRREVWQQIRRLNDEKTTIILTTHYMDEAEKLCNRIAFVDKGKLISLDTLDNLKRLIPSGDIIEIGCDAITGPLLDAIRSLNLVNTVEAQKQKITIRAQNGSRVMPAVFAAFTAQGALMTSIAIRSPSLEDVFIYLTGKKLDDGNNDAAPAPRGGRGRP